MENVLTTFNFINNSVYVFIDYIYINEILECIFSDEDKSDLSYTLKNIRSKKFKYSYNPYALFKSNSTLFALEKIRAIEPVDIDSENLNQFCSDSGLIVVVEVECFLSFINDFDDEKFFESIEGLGYADYWPKIKAKYPDKVYYFYTSDVDPESAGGGNFQII